MKTVKLIEVQEWDKLVQDTYGKPYKFQQQDGCKDRGVESLTVPAPYEEEEEGEYDEDYPEPVKFQDWLTRDPKEPNHKLKYDQGWMLEMWWERNFYPDVQAIANDLHSKGLLEAGDYFINIDW